MGIFRRSNREVETAERKKMVIVYDDPINRVVFSLENMPMQFKRPKVPLNVHPYIAGMHEARRYFGRHGFTNVEHPVRSRPLAIVRRI